MTVNHSVRVRASLSMLTAAVAAGLGATDAQAATFYYGGYDVGTSTQGTPDLPVSGNFVEPGQVTFYSDAAGTTPNAAGTGFVTASDTSAELVLGGGPTAANYNATTPTSSSSIAIRAIALTSTNPGTNTLTFGFTGSGRYSLASGGTGVYGVGVTLNGTSNWNFVNGGGAGSPVRIQNSSTIGGTGTGTLSIPFNIASTGNGPSLTVNLTGGGTVVLGANNDFGSSGSAFAAQFTLTNGTVDFLSARPFGNARNQVRLNGGTLTSSTGATVSTVYTGTAQTGAPGGILIGGNVTFAGATPWSLGTSTVTLTGDRTITANTGGAAGTTIAGAIGESGGAFGLTLGAASTGTLTLTGANTYTGATTVNGGTLAVPKITLATPTAYTTNAGGTLKLLAVDTTSDTTGRSAANATTLVNNGRLDVGETGIVLSDADAAVVRAQIVSGRGGAGGTATWAGATGITSSRAALTPANRAVGYTVSGTTVTVAQTVAGDANLDGRVNAFDRSAYLGNVGQSGRNWQQADFNYDGNTNAFDRAVYLANVGTSIDPAPPALTLDNTVANDSIPNVTYDPTTGKVTLATDGLNTINAFILHAAQADVLSAVADPDGASGVAWSTYYLGGQNWESSVFSSAGDLTPGTWEIATLKAGLGAGSFTAGGTGIDFILSNGNIVNTSVTVAAIPEPTTLAALAGLGVAGFGRRRRR